MRERYDAIRALGGEVLAISFSPPETLAAYQKLHSWPFPVVADPSLQAYRALGMGRARWRDFLRPRVIGHFLKLIFRGWLPAKTRSGDDLLQLGGDFVLDGQRRLVYGHPSQDASDRPPVEELLRAFHDARGAPHL